MVNGFFLGILFIILFLLAHSIILSQRKTKIEFASPFRKYFSYVQLFLMVSLALLPLYILSFLLIPDNFFSRLIRLSGYLENVDFLNGVIVYFILSFFYLNFYYIVDRSVSVKMMIKIEDSPGRKVTFAKIKEIYDIDNKYLDELNGMIQGGFIVEESGYYRNTLKGSCYAQIVKLLKRYFKLGHGG